MRLTVEHVSYSHRHGPRVLEGVSFSAEVGESVAIVGPSGSGKTTLLSVVGGLLAPEGGAVRLADCGGDLPLAPNVSWVLQTVNVLADRTVGDNVAVGAFADGLDRAAARARASRALADVGLGGQERRNIRTLSGGEAQRAVIARAVVSRRPLLLADEPTGQLDRETSEAVIDVLLSAASATIALVVTHDPMVANRCSRTLELADGTVSRARA